MLIIYNPKAFTFCNFYWCQDDIFFCNSSYKNLYNGIMATSPQAKNYETTDPKFQPYSLSDDSDEEVIICDTTIVVAVTIFEIFVRFWKQNLLNDCYREYA